MAAQRQMRRKVASALTIAGSDPSGGAGLQADLKSFHQHHVYGMAVVTVITVQSTRSVADVVPVSAQLVEAQLRHLLADVTPSALKTGALGSAEIVSAVVRALQGSAQSLVVDPVMVSKHGHSLLSADAREAMVALLFPLATLVTPNAEEAALLSGHPVTTLDEARAAARAIVQLGPANVLVKGGHLGGERSVDVLCSGGATEEFDAPRVDTIHTHGTGCSLSAAITANLATGMELSNAVRAAKAWLNRALKLPPDVGNGILPVDHFARVR